MTAMISYSSPAVRALELVLLGDPAVAIWLTRTALAAGDGELAATVARTAQALADAQPGRSALAAARRPRGLTKHGLVPDRDARSLRRWHGWYGRNGSLA
jgi:hypothetical protein